jgi:hypothetical protein
MSMAKGMVMAVVTMPQGLSARALSTTRPRFATRITRMPKMANMAMVPAGPLTSSRTISARDFPSRRTEANRITKSCTAPPSSAPIRIHSVPGR